MARKTYSGHSITSLRQWARDLKIAGRSKMTGDELLVACRAEAFANLRHAEDLVMRQAGGTLAVGTLLRHRSSGDIVRVTSDVRTWEGVGSLYVLVEYVEASGWGDNRRTEYAAAANRVFAASAVATGNTRLAAARAFKTAASLSSVAPITDWKASATETGG